MAKRQGGKNIGKGRILRTYNCVVMNEVRKMIADFLFRHGVSVTDIVIQCDGDCVYFAKAGALKHTRKGIAYKLSDYVAWCNNRGKNLSTVTEIDFTSEIPSKMKRILKLK